MPAISVSKATEVSEAKLGFLAGWHQNRNDGEILEVIIQFSLSHVGERVCVCVCVFRGGVGWYRF